MQSQDAVDELREKLRIVRTVLEQVRSLSLSLLRSENITWLFLCMCVCVLSISLCVVGFALAVKGFNLQLNLCCFTGPKNAKECFTGNVSKKDASQ